MERPIDQLQSVVVPGPFAEQDPNIPNSKLLLDELYRILNEDQDQNEGELTCGTCTFFISILHKHVHENHGGHRHAHTSLNSTQTLPNSSEQKEVVDSDFILPHNIPTKKLEVPCNFVSSTLSTEVPINEVLVGQDTIHPEIKIKVEDDHDYTELPGSNYFDEEETTEINSHTDLVTTLENKITSKSHRPTAKKKKVKHHRSNFSLDPGEKPFKCETCGKCFSKAMYLKLHHKSHTKEIPNPKCDICGKSFTRKTHLKEHQRLHTGEKPYECDQCERSFTRSDTLSLHKRIHTGEKPNMCDVCGKTFVRSNQLTIHKKSHTGEKPYECPICNNQFINLTNLTVHKRIHTGERPYKCDQCEMSFAQKGTLTIHKRIHTGERSYKCEVCGKGFSASNRLTEHKRVHTGERPYKCEECGKRFTHKSHLSEHKIIHTREKPFKCDVCVKSFSRQSYLNTHIKTHTSAVGR